MNIINRLLELSVADLQRLQTRVLKEIERRKRLADTATPAADGSVVGGQKPGKGKQPAPAPVKPVRLRRAA